MPRRSRASSLPPSDRRGSFANRCAYREQAERGELLFGTIDSWLIWNLTNGKVHVTDYSNACRTMLFDIDKLYWDPFLCEKLGIPMSMLPEVKPSSCIYGEVAKITGIEDIAGVPIAGAIGDQPGALFE